MIRISVVLCASKTKNSRTGTAVCSPLIITSGIAMHHIYCEHKKSFIVDRAKQLNLGGLYLFGKPGRVVVEGLEQDVLRYERDLRCLRWQKIQVMGRHTHTHVEGDQARRCFDEGRGLVECETVHSMTNILTSLGLSRLNELINKPFGAPRVL